MDFFNNAILPRDLPSVNQIDFNPIERSYLTTQRITWGIALFIVVTVGICMFYFIPRLQSQVIIYSTIVTITGFFIFFWIRDTISFRFSGYAIRDKDIMFRHGWLVRRSKIVPLNRIQHVSVQSGPLERRFLLASVSIFTAGSGAADFTIKGITDEKAQQIKSWISSQLNGNTNDSE